MSSLQKNDRYYGASEVYQTLIPDPIFVKKVEKSLGRKLMELERSNLVPLWAKENDYFDRYVKGAVRVEIPEILFPDEG